MSDVEICEMSYVDNPFISDESLAEIEQLKRDDYEKFLWVYEGQYKPLSSGQIITRYKVIKNIDLSELPFHSFAEMKSYGYQRTQPFEKIHGRKGAICVGLDLGYSSSPTQGTIGWYSKELNRITILDEFFIEHATLDELARLLPAQFPILKERHIPIWADSNWPLAVQNLKVHSGLDIKSVVKWPNSVLEGVLFLQSCDICICERCTHFLEDVRLYRWAVDANGQEIRGEPHPEKKFDHGIDALRYSLWRVIKDDVGYANLNVPGWGG